MRGRTTTLVTALATMGLATGLVAGLHPASAAGAPVNLVVTKTTVDRTALAEGDTLHVSFTARNTGRKKAGKSRTRFYLTRDWAESRAARKASTSHPRSAPMDVLLVGEAAVPTLAPGGSAKVKKVELQVPIGTQPGSYTVLACADDTGKVDEKSETDNCRPATELGVTAPEGNDELDLAGFADTYAWPDDEDEAWNVDYIKSWCGQTVAPRVMTLAGALTSTRKYLAAEAGASALALLEESGQADTPADAQEVAAVGAIEGVPGLALAGFMRAHELEPKIGGHLVNAAGAALSIGLPNEALAMLDASAGRQFRRPAMGISQQAVALVVRGQAMVLTGRLAEAETFFEAAKAAEPMLSEADSGLATVEACRGNDTKAIRFLRKSRQRSQEKDTTPPTEDVERPAPALDYENGKETPMREFPLAGTPQQTVVMHDVYRDMEDSVLAEYDEIYREEDRIEKHLRETDEARTIAERERRDSILTLVWGAGLEEDIDTVSQAATDKNQEIHQLLEDVWAGPSGTGGAAEIPDLSAAAYDACSGSADPDCYIKEMHSTCRPAVNLAHQEWRDYMTELEALLNEEFRLLSHRISTYAANLLDEEAHRLAALAIEWHEAARHLQLVRAAKEWSHYVQSWEEECVAELPADVMNVPGPSSALTIPCSEQRGKMAWVAAFGPVKVKVTCEKVTLDSGAEVLPLLHAFGEITYNYRTGKSTIFAGSKAEAKVAGVVEAGFKSGIYINSDSEGNITDVGWRVGPGVSAVGVVREFELKEDMKDISFLPESLKEP